MAITGSNARIAALLAFVWGGCSLYQRPPELEIAPPQNPGDRCVDRSGVGRTRPCPDGMMCAGARYERRKMIEPNRCQVVTGRCAARNDCGPGELCIRNTNAIGYCAPGAGFVPPAASTPGSTR